MKILPQPIDLTRLLPAYGFVPIDFTQLMPVVDIGQLISAQTNLIGLSTAISASLPKPFAGWDFSSLPHRLDDADWYPPNWPTALPDPNQLNLILNEEGIPLVWAPRLSIVQRLLNARDRAARMTVLLSCRNDIIEDCAELVDQLTHDRLINQHALALKVLSTYTAGHDEAAHALAVVVTDSAVKAIFTGKYEQIPSKAKIDIDETPYRSLRLLAALAPIGRFYVEWRPGSGGPQPQALSRHVSVHHPGPDHYSPANAILAVLLMASVLKGAQDYWVSNEPK